MSQDREMGSLDARMTNVENKTDDILTIVREMKTNQEQGKGARKALNWVYLFVIAIISLKFGVISHMFTGK